MGGGAEYQQTTLTLRGEFAAYAYDQAATAYALATVHAPEYIESADDVRAPVDLVAVIDRSGSMSGAKLDLVKKALEFMVTQLKPVDRLGLVSFDTDVRTDFDLVGMDGAGKQLALKKIKALSAGSCTNLSGALFQALDLMNSRKSEFKDRPSSVFMFTDGVTNCGITERPAFVAATKNVLDIEAKSSKPAIVSTFGFGTDHDALMLREISEVGRGSYYYIEDESSITKSMAGALGGLLTTVAQNLKITLTLNGTTTFKEVHVTAAGLAINSARNEATITIGDLQSDERRDILLEIQLPQLSAEDSTTGTIVGGVLSYFDTNLKQLIKAEAAPAIFLRPAETPARDEESEAVKEIDQQRNRLDAAKAIEEASKLAEARDFEAAKARLNACSSHVMSSRTAYTTESAQILQDLESCRALTSASAYEVSGSKVFNSYAQSHAQQRSNNESSTSYVTKKKAAFKSVF